MLLVPRSGPGDAEGGGTRLPGAVLSVTASVVPAPALLPLSLPCVGCRLGFGAHETQSRGVGPLFSHCGSRFLPAHPLQQLGVAVTARGTLGDARPADTSGTGREKEAAGQ